MIHYPEGYQITEATPRSPVHECECGGDLKFTPATAWTPDEVYGCVVCGKLIEPYRKAAALNS